MILGKNMDRQLHAVCMNKKAGTPGDACFIVLKAGLVFQSLVHNTRNGCTHDRCHPEKP